MKKKIEYLAAGILFTLLAACSDQPQKDEITESTTKTEYNETEQVVINEELEKTVIIINGSGIIITIECSDTHSQSTITIGGSSSKKRSKRKSWENPWDDSRWQDNKVPWLEHTQGYQ